MKIFFLLKQFESDIGTDFFCTRGKPEIYQDSKLAAASALTFFDEEEEECKVASFEGGPDNASKGKIIGCTINEIIEVIEKGLSVEITPIDEISSVYKNTIFSYQVD